MKMLRTFVLASLAFLALAAPAVAQMQGNGFQNGAPLAPSISGADPLSGLYFGPSNHVGISGHIEAGAKTSAIPTASLCGAAVDAGSSDTAGTITNVGTTTCTLTFGTPFVVKPACIVSDLTGTRAAMGSVSSPTALTITGITAADALAWVCVGKSGG